MLQLFIIWISTLVISHGMDLSLFFRIFKDVADCDYKINFRRLSELGDYIQPEQTTNSFIIKLIPILNVLESLKNVVDYGNARSHLLDELSVLDCIDEMTNEEKELYKKRPSGFTAMVISLKSEIESKVENNNSKGKITITFNEDNKKGKIVFKFNDKKIDNDVDFDIISAEGIAAEMSVEEQKRKVREEFEKLGNAVKLKYGSIDNFAEKLNLEKKISINLDKEKRINETIKEKSNKERIAELNELKRYLLEENREETAEKDEDGYSYRRKK